MLKQQHPSTSWQPVSKWYNRLVGEKGSYYHQSLILPRSLKLLRLKDGDALLDLGCGQGVLARQIPREVEYCGVDNARGLLQEAQKWDHNPRHRYLFSDITRPLSIARKDFSHAAVILALQNVAEPALVIHNAAAHLRPGGGLLIVINHPCFRIPRQSSWETDKQNKLQYRRINRYMTPLRVPINVRPSQPQKGFVAWSFHFPISYYSQVLNQNGFVIEKIEEWCSDKESVGKAGRRENRARAEFPLFMAISAKNESINS